jgi:hypothetical protein
MLVSVSRVGLTTLLLYFVSFWSLILVSLKYIFLKMLKNWDAYYTQGHTVLG